MRSRSTHFATLLLAALALTGCSLFGSDEKEPQIGGERISVLELDQRLEADPRIADLDVVLGDETANIAWPQPGGNASHSLGRLALEADFEEVWRTSIGEGSSNLARLTAPPIIADGKVFTLDAEAELRALDPATGERLWTADLTPEGERSAVGFGGGLAFNDGQLYAATGFGLIYALAPETGAVIWTRDVGVPVRAAPTATDGRVFIGSTDNRMFALDAADGTVLWTHRGIEEPAGVLSATSPAVTGEVVIAPFSSGEVVALRADNGRVTWADSLTRTGRFTALTALNDIAGRPVVDGGRVYAVSHSGRLVAIDLRTGERIWTRDIASTQMPWISGDFLFLVTTDAQLVCISARDGRVRWITQLQRWEDERDEEDAITWSGPVIGNDRLYLVSSHEELIAVSPYTGDVLQTIDLPEAVYVQPVIAGRTLYLLTDDGRLIAYR